VLCPNPVPRKIVTISCASTRQHFALKRHLPRASRYRKQLADRFVTWREFTKLTLNPSFAC